MPRQKGATLPRGEYVQAVETASGVSDGIPFVVRAGEIFAADHDAVRAHPEWFAALAPERQRPVVEQMTAAPGQRRGE